MSGSAGAAGTTSLPPASSATAAPPPTPDAADAAHNAEELEETVSRLFSHPGVQAVLILNRAGDVLVERTTSSLRSYAATASDEMIGSTNDSAATTTAGATKDLGVSSNHPPTPANQPQQILPKRLNHLLQSVRAMLSALPDPQGVGSDSASENDDLGFLQIRSADGSREVLVAPHRGYVLAVIKMPSAAAT